MMTNMPHSFDGFRSLFQDRSRVGRLRGIHSVRVVKTLMGGTSTHQPFSKIFLMYRPTIFP